MPTSMAPAGAISPARVVAEKVLPSSRLRLLVRRGGPLKALSQGTDAAGTATVPMCIQDALGAVPRRPSGGAQSSALAPLPRCPCGRLGPSLGQGAVHRRVRARHGGGAKMLGHI